MIQKYRANVAATYKRFGKEAEEMNVKLIKEWHELKWITLSQKEHLCKVNKNYSKAFK